MNLLEITPSTPKSAGVTFSPSGTLSLFGVSCEEDPKPFFQQLNNWINDYFSATVVKTDFEIRLKYFNTSSAKCLLDMLENVVIKNASKNPLSIIWCVEKDDDDMKDAVTLFEELIKNPIIQKEVPSY